MAPPRVDDEGSRPMERKRRAAMSAASSTKSGPSSGAKTMSHSEGATSRWRGGVTRASAFRSRVDPALALRHRPRRPEPRPRLGRRLGVAALGLHSFVRPFRRAFYASTRADTSGDPSRRLSRKRAAFAPVLNECSASYALRRPGSGGSSRRSTEVRCSSSSSRKDTCCRAGKSPGLGGQNLQSWAAEPEAPARRRKGWWSTSRS